MDEKEKLLQLIEQAEYSSEQIQKVLDDICTIMADVVELFRAVMQKFNEAIGPVIDEIAKNLAAIDVPQKKKLPRPPRYIGPQHNNPKQWQRPARVALSSCRKIRR
jgi:hypothetical protein